MTPPAATAATVRRPQNAAGVRGRRPAGPAAGRRAVALPRGARRVSGPSSGLGAMRVSGAPAVAGGGVLHAPLGLRIARRAATVPDARFLDRLIRGRVWIALVGTMLIGLVFLQLSLLSLNAGIGTSMESAQVLERQNAALRTQVSTMDADQRVQDAAARDGLVMPSAGARHYLKAGTVSAAVAARRITTPKAPATVATLGAAAALPVASAAAAPAVAAAPTTAAVAAAPATAATATTATTAPATATTPPATATPTVTAPATTAPVTAPATTAPATAAAASGGASPDIPATGPGTTNPQP